MMITERQGWVLARQADRRVLELAELLAKGFQYRDYLRLYPGHEDYEPAGGAG